MRSVNISHITLCLKRLSETKNSVNLPIHFYGCSTVVLIMSPPISVFLCRDKLD